MYNSEISPHLNALYLMYFLMENNDGSHLVVFPSLWCPCVVLSLVKAQKDSTLNCEADRCLDISTMTSPTKAFWTHFIAVQLRGQLRDSRGPRTPRFNIYIRNEEFWDAQTLIVLVLSVLHSWDSLIADALRIFILLLPGKYFHVFFSVLKFGVFLWDLHTVFTKKQTVWWK